MFSCFACERSQDKFGSNSSLLMHIRSHHPFLKEFKCSDQGCVRSFAHFNSFRSHRYSKHADEGSVKNNSSVSIGKQVFLDDAPESVCQEILLNHLGPDQLFKNLDTEDPIDILQNLYEVTENDEDIFDDHVLEERNWCAENINFLSEKSKSKNVGLFNSKFIKFIAELYSFGCIGRKKIDIIIRSASS